MEIKGLYSVNRLPASQNSARVTSHAEAKANTAKETAFSDSVSLSPEAKFKLDLAAASKEYAAEFESRASSPKIESLKEAYKGDNCPVSSDDIASAILNRVLGPETHD